jgi:hypothetical protein
MMKKAYRVYANPNIYQNSSIGNSHLSKSKASLKECPNGSFATNIFNNSILTLMKKF